MRRFYFIAPLLTILALPLAVSAQMTPISQSRYLEVFGEIEEEETGETRVSAAALSTTSKASISSTSKTAWGTPVLR